MAACRCGASGPPNGIFTGGAIQASDLEDFINSNLPEYASLIQGLAGQRYKASQGTEYVAGMIAQSSRAEILATLFPTSAGFSFNTDYLDSTGITAGNRVRAPLQVYHTVYAGSASGTPDGSGMIAAFDATLATLQSTQPSAMRYGYLIRDYINGLGVHIGGGYAIFGLP